MSSTMLMLSLNPSPLEGGCTADPLPKRSPQKGLEVLLEFWVLLAKLPQKHFDRLSLKSALMNTLF